MEKRYAIVRVDNKGIKCPDEFEEKIKSAYVCAFYDKENFSCDNCRYGDTKEQLIVKVKQALGRKLKDDKLVYIGIPKKRNIRIETLAKEIVEFLGVEE